MIKSSNCMGCGVAFVYETTGGRPRVFCQPSCRTKRHNDKRRSECIDCCSPTSRKDSRCRICAGIAHRGSLNYKRGSSLSNGYTYLSGYQEHPNSNGAGQIAEHVLVMSEKIGRPLVIGENVHHLNGARSDNRPENLELWSRAQPPGQRVSDKVNYAIEILSLYQPELLSKAEL